MFSCKVVATTQAICDVEHLPAASDLDDDGMPKIFSVFKFSTLALEAQISRSSLCAEQLKHVSRSSSLASLSATSAAETVHYDEDGFPVLQECPLDNMASPPLPRNGTETQHSNSRSFALDPNPQRRKTAVLDSRVSTPTQKKPKKAKKDSTPPSSEKTAAKAVAPKKTTQQKPQSTTLTEDLILVSPHVAKTTETNPRAELCARALVNGSKVRVYVCTATLYGWGPGFADDMQIIADKIAEGGMTRRQCLEFRDSLKAARKAAD